METAGNATSNVLLDETRIFPVGDRINQIQKTGRKEFDELEKIENKLKDLRKQKMELLDIFTPLLFNYCLTQKFPMVEYRLDPPQSPISMLAKLLGGPESPTHVRGFDFTRSEDRGFKEVTFDGPEDQVLVVRIGHLMVNVLDYPREGQLVRDNAQFKFEYRIEVKKSGDASPEWFDKPFDDPRANEG